MKKIDCKELDQVLSKAEEDCVWRTQITASNGEEHIELYFERSPDGTLVKVPGDSYHLVMKARLIRFITETAAGIVIRRYLEEVNPETGVKQQEVQHYFAYERDGRVLVDKTAEFKE